MVEHDPAAVVRAHLAAFSAGDVERMLATLAPTAHFMTGVTVVHPAEFSEFFGWAIREILPTIEIGNLLVDGDRVACEFVEAITVNGKRQELRRAAFYRVTDDVITSVKVYDERE